MSTLRKRFPRTIRHNLGRYIALLLLLIFSVGLGNGYMQAAQNSIDMTNDMRSAYHVEDGRIETDFEASDAAITAAEDFGATLYKNYSRDIDLTASGDSSEVNATVRLYGERDGFDEVAYAEGRAPEGDNDIALDRVFMQSNNLSLGDLVKLNGEEFTICGVATFSDYLTLFESNTDIVYNNITFGVGQVLPSVLERLAEGDLTYTYSYLLDNRDMETADRISLLEDMVDAFQDNGVTVRDASDYEYNQSISYAMEDNQSDKQTAQSLLIILTAVLAFVFVMITSASIDQESVAIGTLLAMGYRKGELVRHYLTIPMAIGVVGCVLGDVFGATVIEPALKNSYYSVYSLPEYVRGFHPDIYVLTTLLPLVLLFVIMLVGLIVKLRLTPLAFLRGETSGKSKKSRGVSLPDGLRYPTRFRLRVFLRNISHFVTLFFGILVANLLLLFSMSVMPAVQNYTTTLKDEMVAEYTYYLKAPLRLDGTEAERTAWKAIEKIATDERYAGIDIDAIGDLADDLDACGFQMKDLKNDDFAMLALLSNLRASDLEEYPALQQIMDLFSVKDYTDLTSESFHDAFVQGMKLTRDMDFSGASDAQLDSLLAHAHVLSVQMGALTDDERTEFGKLLEDMSAVDDFDNPVNTIATDQATIDQAEAFAVASLQVPRASGGKMENVKVYGIQEDSQYWNIDVSDGKVAVDGGLADKCALATGSAAEFTDKTTGKTYSITPEATTDSTASTNVYMSIDTFNEMFGEDSGYFNGYFSNEELGIDERYLRSVYTPSDVDKIADQMEASFGDTMLMIMDFSIPIYLLLIYLLTKTVIDRSARSIAYMKVFGYRNGEIDNLYLKSIVIAVVVSLIVGIPILDVVIAGLFKPMMMAMDGNFVYSLSMQTILIDLVVGIVTSLLIIFIHARRIKKIPLSLALKVTD